MICPFGYARGNRGAIAMARSVFIAVALVLAGGPAAAVQTAIGFQILEDFEGRALGATSINFCDVADPAANCLGTLTGGSVALATAEFPANSLDHVYTGTAITLDIVNAVDFSWPAVAARVSGTMPIRLQAYTFDYDLAIDVLIGDISTAGSDTNTLLGFGSDSDPYFLSLIRYSSDATFAIDDFRIGLPDVSPGIPEPANWLMLIAGFGLVGSALRLRRPGRQLPAVSRDWAGTRFRPGQG
jgi:hypothetical protein